MPDKIVIVRDRRIYGDDPGGRYGIVRAGEWCQFPDEVTLWRGPDKLNEKVETKYLTEVTCRQVQIDDRGYFVCTESSEREFYPCPEMTKKLVDFVSETSEEMLNTYANQHAAETESYIGHEQMIEKLGNEWSDKIFSIGEFEEGLAVNGEPVTRKSDLDPPEGWIKTDLGGRTDGGEAEIPKSELAEWIAHQVEKKLKIKAAGNIVFRVLDSLYPRHDDYVVWSSDYGEGSVWLSRAAMNELVRIEEEEGKREWSGSYETPLERRRRKAEESERRKKEAALRRQQLREHRSKLKEGGYPAPRDWSPRGRLPGE